jgi:hypothetical protein
MGKRIFIIIISLFFVVLVACKQETHYSVDVSKINLELPFYRFDKELYQIPNDSLSKKAFALINRYPHFMQLYAYRIIKIGNPYSKDFASRLQVFKSEYHTFNSSKFRCVNIPDRFGIVFYNPYNQFRFGMFNSMYHLMDKCDTGTGKSSTLSRNISPGVIS